jgi:hypothetical protein
MNVVLDTPEQIEFFQLLAMRGRLQLEMKGLRFRTSTLKAVNKKLGTNYKRKAQAVEALTAIIEERTDVHERQH